MSLWGIPCTWRQHEILGMTLIVRAVAIIVEGEGGGGRKWYDFSSVMHFNAIKIFVWVAGGM